MSVPIYIKGCPGIPAGGTLAVRELGADTTDHNVYLGDGADVFLVGGPILASIFLAIDGSNANVTLDIGDEDFVTTGDVTADNYVLAVTDADSGQIIQNSNRIFHTFEPNDQVALFRNVFIGKNSGNFTMNNVAASHLGSGNIGIGDSTLDALTTGFYNFGLGTSALSGVTDGHSNVGIGHQAGKGITTGDQNIMIGRDAGVALTIGNQNTFIGTASGLSGGVNLDRCVFIGYSAGRDEDTDDRLIIDNRDRGSAAATRTDAIIYGVMAAVPADQTLFVNANLEVSESIATPGTVIGGGSKCQMTPIGGYAIKLTNTTGAVTVAGQLVKADSATNDAVVLTGADDLEGFGVFLDSGIADDAEAWVVIAGIADVAMEDNTTATRGNWVRVSITEAGYADATNLTVPQPINQTHFAEIGHCIETVTATGGGTHILARCVLHFN